MKTFLSYLILVGFDTTPLTRLKIAKEEYKSETNKDKANLCEKIYSLDADQVSFILEQTKVAEAFKVKSRKGKSR